MRFGFVRKLPVALLLLFSTAFGNYANAAIVSQERPAPHILTTIYAPPFAIEPEEEGDSPSGFIYDLVAIAFAELQFDVKSQFYPLARALKKYRDGEGEVSIVSTNMLSPSDRVLTVDWVCSLPIFYVPTYLYENRERLPETRTDGFDHLQGYEVLISESVMNAMGPRLPDSVEYQVMSDPNKLAKMFWYERAYAFVSTDYLVDNFLSENPIDFQYSRRLIGHVPVEICIHRRVPNAEETIAQFNVIWNRLYRDRDQDPVRSILRKYDAKKRWNLSNNSR